MKIQRNVGACVPNYTGPRDGLSHPQHTAIARPVNNALMDICFRTEVHGRERLPESGRHVYCPTHPSVFDPPLVATLCQRDMRYMANMYVFQGVRGTIMSWGGAFPVNREQASVQTVRHCVDLLKQDVGLCIFPEGTVDEAHARGEIGSFKRGSAWVALQAGAESLVPINVNYAPSQEKRVGETARALGAAVVAVTAAAAAASFGSPAVQAVAGALGGALFGAFAGGKLAYERTASAAPLNHYPKLFAALQGGALGALTGALAGAGLAHLAPALSPAVATAGAAGLYGLLAARRDRTLARLTVSQPVPVAPFAEQFAHKEGRDAAVVGLTEALHRTIGQRQSEITGVPYNDAAPKLRGHIVETMKPG